jgi:hypothetical protein
MAYVYHVGFYIRPDQLSELQIGASLERVLAYLRTLLPGEPGHISSRALHSVDTQGRTHLLFESTWETWDDLQAHRGSALSEDKVLAKFQPHVTLEDLDVHTYQEVD